MAPVMTTTASPAMRSLEAGRMLRWRSPPRGEHWRATRLVSPSSEPQYGARTVWAEPVTGSSGIPFLQHINTHTPQAKKKCLPRSEVSGEEVIVAVLTEQAEDDSFHPPRPLQSRHPPGVRPQPLQLPPGHGVLQNNNRVYKRSPPKVGLVFWAHFRKQKSCLVYRVYQW